MPRVCRTSAFPSEHSSFCTELYGLGGSIFTHIPDLCGRTDGQGELIPRRNTDSRLGEIPRKEVRKVSRDQGRAGLLSLVSLSPQCSTLAGWPYYSHLASPMLTYPPPLPRPAPPHLLALALPSLCSLVWAFGGEVRVFNGGFFPSILRSLPRLSLGALLQPLRLKSQHGRKVGTLPLAA